MLQETEPTIAEAPDWSQLDRDIVCPLCEYNLHGLAEPRCPECGYRFEWPEVLDPRRRLHAYLFEHHPERNAWSFLRTALGALRPRKFWLGLSPVQPSRPRRLVVYWCIGAGLYTLVCLVIPALFALQRWTEIKQSRDRIFEEFETRIAMGDTDYISIAKSYGSVEAFVDASVPATSIRTELGKTWRERDLALVLGTCVVLPFGWAWLTVASLLVFQISMRRARIRNIHVLRCVLYSFDAALWVGVSWIASLVVVIPREGGLSGILNDTLEISLRLIGLAWVLATLHGIWRLWSAYRRYLRFDHPLATVLTSQFLVGLAALNVLLFWTVGR